MIGIMSAIPQELGNLTTLLEGATVTTIGRRTYHTGRLWGREVAVVFSHWGKVASATAAANLITQFGAQHILFTGVAGAIDPSLNIGDMVVANQFVQHDLDARPVFRRYEVPMFEKTHLDADPALQRLLLAACETFVAQRHPSTRGVTPRVALGLVATGDRFFSSASDVETLRDDVPGVLCVEMEGAAVAQVCFEHAIPLGVVRTISDRADHAAPIDFNRFIQDVACVYSLGILENALTSWTV